MYMINMLETLIKGTIKLMFYHLKTRRFVSLIIVIELLFTIVINDVTSKSREQRLITKKHIAMNTNLILLFKLALYSSILVIKLFKNSIKLFFKPEFLL